MGTEQCLHQPLWTKPVFTQSLPAWARWTVTLNSVAPAVFLRFAGATGGHVRGQSLPGFGSWARKGTDHRAAVGLPCLAEGRLNAQRASKPQPFPQKKRKLSVCKKRILAADHLVLPFCYRSILYTCTRSPQPDTKTLLSIPVPLWRRLLDTAQRHRESEDTVVAMF